MRAARINRYGGPEELGVADVPRPTAAPGLVVVEVHASSLNPVDVAVRSGWMAEFLPMSPPLTLGTDLAGTVAELGEGVDGFDVGDPVFGVAGVAMGGSGAFAEFATTSPGLLATPPQGVDLLAAATLPLAGLSALQALTAADDVRAGCRVLVHGASGGVGLFAIELARHLGAHVVATAHGAGLTEVAAAGADEVVDTDETDPATLGEFDVTLDLVGTDPGLSVRTTRAGGRAVGLRAAPDPDAAAAKGVTADLQATTVTSESLARLSELVEEGAVQLHVDQTIPLTDIVRAFALKASGGIPGKIAIAVR